MNISTSWTPITSGFLLFAREHYLCTPKHPYSTPLTQGFRKNVVTSAQHLMVQLYDEHIVDHNGCG